MNVNWFQQGTDIIGDAGLFQVIKIGSGCHDETGWHRDTGACHLAKIGSLAAYKGNVFFGYLVKPDNGLLSSLHPLSLLKFHVDSRVKYMQIL